MTKPTTDAGRRYSEQPPGSLDEWNVAILAIENEARANVTSHVTFPTPPSLDVKRLLNAVDALEARSIRSGGEFHVWAEERELTAARDAIRARLTTEGEKP